MAEITFGENLDRTPEGASLSEAHGTIRVPSGVPWWRKMLAYVGPGFLVSVGYMDPGNWGTDIGGGARYGYRLLWVVALSSLMAMFLQTLCARLGIASRKDLARACREHYPKPVAMVLWVLAEVAIVACDLAEVVGSSVALNLLFGIPLLMAVLITAADVLLLIGFMHLGFRKLEAVVTTLVATVAGCFLYEVVLAKPQWGEVAGALVRPSIPDAGALLLALGILGATVMPHNLYLHSSVVQTREVGHDFESKKQAIRFNTVDTLVSLFAAFFVNAAILIVAAAVFHANGHTNVEELQEAHRLLTPLLGGASSTAFAVALLASGQSSTITGTLAGQIVMEGFLRIRLKPWMRRMLTRGLAIVPAAIMIGLYGAKDTMKLLVVSQVILSLQLPFAVFPLVRFTSDRKVMGDFVNTRFWAAVGYAVAAVITGLNLYLLWTLLVGG